MRRDYSLFVKNYELIGDSPKWWALSKLLFHPCQVNTFSYIVFELHMALDKDLSCYMYVSFVFEWHSLISSQFKTKQYQNVNCVVVRWFQGMPLSFESPVASIFKTLTNLLNCGWIASTTGNFALNNKGRSSILSRNRHYGLWPLMKALESCSQQYWDQQWPLLTESKDVT